MVWYADLFNCINLNLGGRAKSNKKLAQFKNWIEFQNAFARLVKKGLARYDFEGLPETVNERVLKQSLLYHGSVCFFEKEGSVLALPAMPNSDLTLYGDFKSCFAYGRNGYNEKVPLYIHGSDEASVLKKGLTDTVKGAPRGVWVRENELVYPFLNYCITYAEKIADTMRTLDVTRKNMKKPYIVVAEEQIVPTVKKYFEDRDDNLDYIVSSGIFPADKINILGFESNGDNLKAATDLIEWYMNDFDALCGQNSNANPDKKERLLVDEVNSNNEAVNNFIESTIRYLQQGLDDVNKFLGTNITVNKTESEEEGEEDDEILRMDSDSGSDEMGS